MPRTIVRSMIAIGQSGQLGLNGVLPWEGNTSPEYVADVARFFDMTRGHVLLAGPKTIGAVPEFIFTGGRSLDYPLHTSAGILVSQTSPVQILLVDEQAGAGKVVWKGAGERVMICDALPVQAS